MRQGVRFAHRNIRSFDEEPESACGNDHDEWALGKTNFTHYLQTHKLLSSFQLILL